MSPVPAIFRKRISVGDIVDDLRTSLTDLKHQQCTNDKRISKVLEDPAVDLTQQHELPRRGLGDLANLIVQMQHHMVPEESTSSARISLCVGRLKELVYSVDGPNTSVAMSEKIAAQFILHNVMEELILPILPLLPFETRKQIGLIVKLLIHENIGGFVQYLGQKPRLLEMLTSGYDRSETALVCGSILRECLTYDELKKVELNNISRMIQVARKQTNFDIAIDAFSNLSRLLTGAIGTEYLKEHDDEFFLEFNQLIQCENFIIKRQALQLLSRLLLDPENFHMMLRYAEKRDNLVLIMKLLREKSDSLRIEAFHVFKVFVANPNPTEQVERILARNNTKLIEFLMNHFVGENQFEEDSTFAKERQLLVYTLKRMGSRKSLPVTSSCSNNQAPPVSQATCGVRFQC